MKKITKILSLLLAAAMVLSLNIGTTAFAEDVKYTITIDNTTTGYSYAAYQIFDGDLSGTAGSYKLANITWGSGVDSTTDDDSDGTSNLMEAIQAISYIPTGETDPVYPFKDCTTAAKVAEVLGSSSYNTTDS